MAGRESRAQRAGARQIVEYLAATRQILGTIPTQHCLVLERFFDEAGGMQLVLHAPFGSRINRAWDSRCASVLCRSFNFELQAAATEDAIVLSLGPQHSFPLEDVFQYLKPATAETPAGAGHARRAGLRDAVALECDTRARRVAVQRRA